MPVVSEIEVPGFLSCPDPLCPGYEQQPTTVVRREVGLTYLENGATDGTVPPTAIERSNIAAVLAADHDEADCPFCGKARIVALELRPEYPPISGQDPLHLLNMNKDRQIHGVQAQGMETQLALEQTRRELAELRADIATQREPVKRGPGRPRREDAEA